MGGTQGTPHQAGVPLPPGPGGGYPLAGRGTPPTRQGYSPTQVQVGGYPGYPPPGRGTPPPDQHSVYLLRGGRYASCVHAGGLFLFQRKKICLSAWNSCGVEGGAPTAKFKRKKLIKEKILNLNRSVRNRSIFQKK